MGEAERSCSEETNEEVTLPSRVTFSIWLHFVLKERIGVAKIGADKVLTTGLIYGCPDAHGAI